MFNLLKNIKLRHILIFIGIILYIIFFMFFNSKFAHAETGADTMVCNYKSVDYFDPGLGNDTYCTNYYLNGDSAVWNTTLGINFISTRINYDLDKNYNYTFYVSQYVSWFDYPTDGIAWINPLTQRILLPNNSTSFTGSVEFVQTQSYTCSAKYCIRIDFKVNIKPNTNVPYFDLDATYKGLYFTGYNQKNIRVASVYTTDKPNYDIQTGINDIINNQNNNTQIIINNQNQNVDKINDTITNDNVDVPDGYFDNITNNFPTNQPISQLVTLPVTLYKRLSNSVVSTCTPYSLGKLYDTELVLPCIKPSNYLKKPIWNFVSAVTTSFLLYYMAKFYYKIFLTVANLKEGKDID